MGFTLLIFLATSIVAGTNTAILKFSVSQFHPFIVFALRFLLATLILLPFVLKQKFSFNRTHITSLLLSSLMFAVAIMLATYSLKFTSVTMHQIIWSLQSLVVAFMAYWILKEKLDKSHVIGLAFALSGAIIIIIQIIKSGDNVTFGTGLGNFLSVLAFFCSCLFVIFSRKSSKFYTPLAITFANFLTATCLSLVLLPFVFLSTSLNNITISQRGIFAIFSLALFSSVTVYYLYQILVRRVLAFIVTLTNYVSMVFALILGNIIYGEKLTLITVVGIILVILGVMFATSFEKLVSISKKLT